MGLNPETVFMYISGPVLDQGLALIALLDSDSETENNLKRQLEGDPDGLSQRLR
jgi:hypothetical protein